MFALITGASSGIGREIAILLAEKKYNLIITARRADRLEKLKNFIEENYKVEVVAIPLDLLETQNIYKLHEKCKNYDVKVLINNAGFGKIGDFWDIPLEEELDMITTNITSLHIITKLFVNSMTSGYILNVASMAAFQPDPKLATYGATKSYVLNLSRAVGYELKKAKKNLHISVLCPGPVDTEFNDVAKGDFNVKAMTAKKCAQIAVNGLFRKKPLIVTGFKMKTLFIAEKFLPIKLLLPIVYRFQNSKINGADKK